MTATASAPVARLTEMVRLLLPPSMYTRAVVRAMGHGWSYAGPSRDGCFLYPPAGTRVRTVLHVSSSGAVTTLPF
jgi:hypothetical protein